MTVDQGVLQNATQAEIDKINRGTHESYADRDQTIAMLKSVARVYVPFFCNATDYAAGTNQQVVSPVAGKVMGIYTVVQAATTGANTSTVNVGAGGTATGLSVTIATSSAVGTNVSDTVAYDSAISVTKGGELEVVFDGVPTGGALNGIIEIIPA